MTKKSKIERFDMKLDSGHSPVSRSNGIYFCIAVFGKNVYGGYGVILLQYLEWPMGEISALPYGQCRIQTF